MLDRSNQLKRKGNTIRQTPSPQKIYLNLNASPTLPVHLLDLVHPSRGTSLAKHAQLDWAKAHPLLSDTHASTPPLVPEQLPNFEAQCAIAVNLEKISLTIPAGLPFKKATAKFNRRTAPIAFDSEPKFVLRNTELRHLTDPCHRQAARRGGHEWSVVRHQCEPRVLRDSV
jgi:hypothetical protein